MKVCIKCGEKKEFSEYYGVQGDCKECTKKRVRIREAEKRKDPKWVKKEKERHQKKYHRLGYKDKHKPTPEAKKEAIRKYKDKYPEKYKAKNASQRMQKEVKENHLHHWSYNEEHHKDVIELTPKVHALIHRYMVYDQERMMYRSTEDNILLDSRELHLHFCEEMMIKYRDDL